METKFKFNQVITEVFADLDRLGRVCNSYNCVCDNMNPNCPAISDLQ